MALVGGSGSGKSTILKLLARLYDVNDGEILVDGINVRDLKHESLRNAIGVIPQDTVLFNASIRENILYGCPVRWLLAVKCYLVGCWNHYMQTKYSGAHFRKLQAT